MTSDLRLPTACDRCDRIWLAPPASDGAAECRFCGGPGHVFPGERYRADDGALFERIERVVYAAQLSEETSQALWNTLADVAKRRREPELLLGPVMKVLPELRFIREVFSENRVQLSHAIGMILVVVSAHLYALEVRQSLSGQAAQSPY